MAKAKRTPAKTSSKKMGTGTKLALLAGAIFGASALMKGSSTKSTPTKPNATIPQPTADTVDTLLAKYNNKIIVDSKGYWIVVQNGKYRTTQDADLANFPAAINVNVDVWEHVASFRPDLIAPTASGKRIQIGA